MSGHTPDQAAYTSRNFATIANSLTEIEHAAFVAPETYQVSRADLQAHGRLDVVLSLVERGLVRASPRQSVRQSRAGIVQFERTTLGVQVLARINRGRSA